LEKLRDLTIEVMCGFN